jgi:ribosome-associated toxin RatA of RatAB toxin-antitoxin module
VYGIAADVEQSPRWQPDIKSVEVLERDADGNQTRVVTTTDAKVRSLRSELRFSYDAPTSVRWTQEDGDVKAIDGSWTFEAIDEGRTRATYEMTVDLGRMLGAVIRGPIQGALRGTMIDSMPGKLKADVESA